MPLGLKGSSACRTGMSAGSSPLVRVRQRLPKRDGRERRARVWRSGVGSLERSVLDGTAVVPSWATVQAERIETSGRVSASVAAHHGSGPQVGRHDAARSPDAGGTESWRVHQSLGAVSRQPTCPHVLPPTVQQRQFGSRCILRALMVRVPASDLRHDCRLLWLMITEVLSSEIAGRV